MFELDFTSLTRLTVAACGTLFVIQLLFILLVHNRLHRAFGHRRPEPDAPENDGALPPLSVILVTKDTGKALEENLPLILQQDYPSFEVIVINAHFSGTDEETLQRLSATYPHLYHTFIPQSTRYISLQKLGIAMGIRASRHEWLVFTDPHCHPVSPHWLRSLARHFTTETDVVLGYSGFEGGQGWNACKVKAQNLFGSMRYLGMALAGRPYMGIGRNLAYRKGLYERHKGFADHLQLQRGEDDLFINEVAHRGNTQVATGPDSIVRQPVPSDKRLWRKEQVQRRLSGRYGSGGGRWLNAADTWTAVLFHLTTIAVFATSLPTGAWPAAGAAGLLWCVRLAVETTVLQRTAHDVGERLCLLSPLLDLLRPYWSLQTYWHYLRRNKQEYMRK